MLSPDDLHGACWGLRTATTPLSIEQLHNYIGRALGRWTSRRGLETAVSYCVETGCVRPNADGTFSWLGAHAGR